MSWPSDLAESSDGTFIDAVLWNKLVDALLFLHGDAGAIELLAALGVGRTVDTGYTLTVAGQVGADAFIAYKDTAGSVMRTHRHPYANDRHIESGTVLITTGTNVAGSASASFTDAFASAPVVMATAQFAGSAPAGGVSAFVASVSTTGVTVWGAPGSGWTSQPVAWLAEGAD